MKHKKQLQKQWSGKKIGVWGYGKVGKSVIRLLLKKKAILELFDNRVLNKREKIYIDKHKISIAFHKENFLTHNDILIASPGIALKDLYQKYDPKWLAELDLFAQLFHKKIIAITGTVGKTSTTTLLSDILSALGEKIVTGGNIGIPCLRLLSRQKKIAHAILEVSSAQLAYTRIFTPDIAVITNLSPNHLDWHGTWKDYVYAKCAPLFRQQEHQHAIMPLSFKEWIYQCGQPTGTCSFFIDRRPENTEIASIGNHETLFYIARNKSVIQNERASQTISARKALSTRKALIVAYKSGVHTILTSLDKLPDITFDQNWVVLCAILYHMDIDPEKKLVPIVDRLAVPEHRLERCAVYNGVTIYNDSKSTTTLSTQAAVEQLHKYPIILILGGLSKGVDRSMFISWLKDKIKLVCTFGNESQQLAAWCQENNIAVIALNTVSEAIRASIQNTVSGDCILFSPSGSSYDQFRDYEHRGRYFKKIVYSYINT